MRFHLPKVSTFLVTCLALVAAIAPVPGLAQTPGWQPGPDGVLDNTYDGFIDAPTSGGTVPGSGSFAVTGWVVDITAQGWAGIDNVQVFLGTMDNGKMIAQAAFAQGRADVAAALSNPFWGASGFAATVQGSSVPAGSQMLSVYAHTSGKGWWYRQVNVNGGGAAAAAPSAPSPAVAAGGPPQVTVTAPGETDNVSATGKVTYTINGTATDPAYGPGAIDSVDVWINGERNGSGGTQLGTVPPDANGKWTLEFKPTKFKSMHSNLYVYAHSSRTGQTTEIIRGFNIVG